MVMFNLFYSNKDMQRIGVFLDKKLNKYRYINLTKGHICKCTFDSTLEALRDLRKYPEIIGVLGDNDKIYLKVDGFIDDYRKGKV